MDFTFDTSDLDALAVDLGKAGRKATLGAAAVIKHAALNIKDDMKVEIEKSPHFSSRKGGRGVAGDISFDIRGLSAEIGPVIGRGKGHQGGLAFIAAYGTGSQPGTWDHTSSLRKELPNIENFLGQIGVESL